MGNIGNKSQKPEDNQTSQNQNQNPPTIKIQTHNDPTDPSPIKIQTNNDTTDPSSIKIQAHNDTTDPINNPYIDSGQTVLENEENKSLPVPICNPDGQPNDGRLNVSELKPNSDRDKYNKRSSINPKSAFQTLNLEDVPYWKNACKVDIDKIKYVWIYSSYYGNGWWYMSPEVNDQVEKLYQMWKTGENISEHNHLRIHGADFKYVFDKMCQINRMTNTNRTIRRLDIDELQKIEKTYEEQIQKVDFVWMYQTQGQKFIPFMPQFQKELEAAYQDYVDHPDEEHYVHYKFKYSNGYDYQLNFKKMTQLNQQTGVRRTISRVPKSSLVNHPEYHGSCGFTQSYQFPNNSHINPDLSQLATSPQTINPDNLINDPFQSAPVEQTVSENKDDSNTVAAQANQSLIEDFSNNMVNNPTSLEDIQASWEQTNSNIMAENNPMPVKYNNSFWEGVISGVEAKDNQMLSMNQSAPIQTQSIQETISNLTEETKSDDPFDPLIRPNQSTTTNVKTIDLSMFSE